MFEGVHQVYDIFNHQNVEFWSTLMVAYNTTNFISCAGTNFAIRASALRALGKPPKTSANRVKFSPAEMTGAEQWALAKPPDSQKRILQETTGVEQPVFVCLHQECVSAIHITLVCLFISNSSPGVYFFGCQV